MPPYTVDIAARKPSRLLQFFVHIIPNDEQLSKIDDIRQLFGELAHSLDANLPDNAEKTVALRHLMESKESAVRAVLYKE